MGRIDIKAPLGVVAGEGKVTDTPNDRAEREWMLDERVGCVAIYLAPKRDCLSGVDAEDDCVLYLGGEKDEQGAWSVAPWKLSMARRCFAALRGRRDAEPTHMVHPSHLITLDEPINPDGLVLVRLIRRAKP